jgi:hypothetical protein
MDTFAREKYPSSQKKDLGGPRCVWQMQTTAKWIIWITFFYPFYKIYKKQKKAAKRNAPSPGGMGAQVPK